MLFQIVVGSLLTSSRLENIKLAGKMMETSLLPPEQTSVRSRKQEGAGSRQEIQSEKKVGYQQAVQLVLQAAQEYFDSSANLTDPCMQLAR